MITKKAKIGLKILIFLTITKKFLYLYMSQEDFEVSDIYILDKAISLSGKITIKLKGVKNGIKI